MVSEESLTVLERSKRRSVKGVERDISESFESEQTPYSS